MGKAYAQDSQKLDIDLGLESIKDGIDLLPKEMFQILGKMISFVENTNKFEGDKNENKQ